MQTYNITHKETKALRGLRGKGFVAVLSLAAGLAFGPTSAATPAGPVYAIKGVKIFTAAGAPIDNGTIVMRNGVIEEVGANVARPADAIVIDGAGMNAYPGLIDMTNDAPIDTGEDAGGGDGRGSRRRGRRRRPGRCSRADVCHARGSRAGQARQRSCGRTSCRPITCRTSSPELTDPRERRRHDRCWRFRRPASSRARVRS